MAIGINWGEVWAPVWKAVWRTTAPAPAPAPAPAQASGPGGMARWYTRVGDKRIVGSKREIEELLQQLAQQHAQEDEARLAEDLPVRKRSVRVIEPGRAKVIAAKRPEAPAVTLTAPVAEQTGMTQVDAEAIYRQAYLMHLHREAIRQDDEEIAEMVERVRQQRRDTLAQVVAQIAKLKGLL